MSWEDIYFLFRYAPPYFAYWNRFICKHKDKHHPFAHILKRVIFVIETGIIHIHMKRILRLLTLTWTTYYIKILKWNDLKKSKSLVKESIILSYLTYKSLTLRENVYSFIHFNLMLNRVVGNLRSWRSSLKSNMLLEI